ncbi:hypothetical protein SprV_0401404000 [Sparganum proliferum]
MFDSLDSTREGLHYEPHDNCGDTGAQEWVRVLIIHGTGDRTYKNVLNRPSTISDAAIDRLPQVGINVDLDLPLSLPEAIRAVQQFSSGNASGSDAIPVELHNHEDNRLMDQLTAVFQEMWRYRQVAQNFRDSTTSHRYKLKGSQQVSDDHRGISLHNIAGNIFARILLSRLNGHLEQEFLPESQCGFRQEACQEMRTRLYTTFVNLTRAFDTASREGLWKTMQKFRCSDSRSGCVSSTTALYWRTSWTTAQSPKH